ncbi:MerR family transcriptional regulator [Shewanella sp.]|uniref:MerR family transcriptional regulator n=1 Tax=Shewanella sp. TaxID=50422 RepID=UPI003F37F5C1
MKISEISSISQVAVKTIRFYEEQGLLPSPKRMANGYRYYTQQDIDTLIFIRRCRALNIGLGDIRRLLDVQQHPHDSCAVVDEIIAEQLERIRQTQRELAKLEVSLSSLVSCDTHHIRDCCILKRLKQNECETEAC